MQRKQYKRHAKNFTEEKSHQQSLNLTFTLPVIIYIHFNPILIHLHKRCLFL